MIPFGNDYLFSFALGPKVVEPEQVVAQIIENLRILAEVGAKKLLVGTMRCGLLPLTERFETHDRLLKEALDIFAENHNVTLYLFQADKLFGSLPSKRFQKETGITKGFGEPCIPFYFFEINNTTTVCEHQELFLLFDKTHPTTKVHEFVASFLSKLLLDS